MDFYFYLYSNYSLECKQNEFIKDNLWILSSFEGANIRHFFRRNQDPKNLFRKILNKNHLYTYYDFNCKNEFIRSMLIEFLEEVSIEEAASTRLKVFIYYFESSFSNQIEQMSSIYDLNFRVFLDQFKYFANLENTIGNENVGRTEYKGRLNNYLVRIYLFLLAQIKKDGLNHSIFTPKDGVDEVFLLRKNFVSLFGEGYRVVYYNRLDSIPETDRWVIAPNGKESFSTALRHDTYTPLNFTIVKNDYLRHLLKHFIWFGNKELLSLINNFRGLMVFMSFLNKVIAPIREGEILKIDLNDVVAFRLYILDNYTVITTQSKMLITAATFLRHCLTYNLLHVNELVFDYLKRVPGEVYGPRPLTEEELTILTRSYKLSSHNGDIHEKLDWIVLQLCLTTNLRINEILGLKVSNIIYCEDSPTYIETKRKGSGDLIKYYYPAEEVIRLLEKAIQITDELREIADKKTKEYIFISKKNRNSIGLFSKDRFYRNYKKVVRENNFSKDYSVYNLRDTFMSLIYEKGIEEGRSLLEIHQSTGHANPETTRKHYRQPSVKGYLEATYFITVGDVNINGKILREEEKDKEMLVKEREVNKRCGYCSHSTCINERDVDCLLCTSFLTTKDRIPYFKAAIKQLDNEIRLPENEFEREELLSIKKLHLTYLNELLCL